VARGNVLRTDGSWLSPQEIMDRDFALALRGFDADQVRSFLRDIAKAHEELRTRIQQLEAETEALRADLHAREEELRGHAAGDDDPLLEKMREATSRVLMSAQEAAAGIYRSTQAEVERTLTAAREEAASIVAEAHRVSAEARESALQDARDRAAALLEEAHRERERVRAEIDEFRTRREEFASSLERVLADARDLADELSPPEED
jgi:DivIVA domain-containing protein